MIEDIRNRQLLVYTDGLNEAENDRQDRLGDERLLEAMQGTEQLSSEEVIHRLQVVVNNHRAGAEPNDDLTLLCLSIRK